MLPVVVCAPAATEAVSVTNARRTALPSALITCHLLIDGFRASLAVQVIAR
jgi:hypothetical protein